MNLALLKIIGAVIVIASSAFVGITLGENIKHRLHSIALLIDFIEYVSMNVTLYRTPLDEIFKGIKNAEMEKCGFLQKLSTGIYTAAKNSGLLTGDEEAKLIRNFDEKIGKGSADESEKLCSYTVSRLKSIEEKLRQELPEKRRVYNTVSILAGASAVIILI